MHPTISRYIETVSEPAGFFRTLAFECERDIYGNPKIMAGGNAAVFKVCIGGKPFALKCYTGNRTSTRTVYEAIPQLGGNLFYRSRFLPQEIYISGPNGGEWYDAALTEWAEGHTLEFAIQKALRGGKGNDPEGGLTALAANFDLLAGELLDAPWAHGDLKPENIIVTPSGHMRLIDYDAMFVPQLQGCVAEESGTPLYRHPRRDIHLFDRHIDDYPIALISATLHTLALDTELYTGFGDTDCFIFRPADIPDGRSKGFRAALEMAAQRGEALLYGLLRLLASPVPWLDGLKDIVDAINNRADTVHATTPFAKEGRWGYLAGDGSIAIPPVFDTALEFREDTGTAAVSIGGYGHFIARNGQPKT